MATSRRTMEHHSHRHFVPITLNVEGSPVAPPKVSIDSSEVPQVWRLRSDGSWTSHNGSSVNFPGDGTIFWGDGTLYSSIHLINSQQSAAKPKHGEHFRRNYYFGWHFSGSRSMSGQFGSRH